MNINSSSASVATYIWLADVEWTGTALLKTITLNTAPIWADYYGYPPSDLTFPYTYHEDLLIPAIIQANPLMFTFDTDDFAITHVKVYFEKYWDPVEEEWYYLIPDCYVQYYP